jgi:hypothetical protein
MTSTVPAEVALTQIPPPSSLVVLSWMTLFSMTMSIVAGPATSAGSVST